MIACRPIVLAALMILGACSPSAAREPSPIAPPRGPTAVEIAARLAIDPAPTAAPEAACGADEGCGYDPDRGRCTSDPRANRQPPVVDQGIVCYCGADHRCATLRVTPVPCESDASCAVSFDPRPHPVAADAAHPHQRGRACRDFTHATTCERTNICTMRAHACPSPKR